MRLHTGYSYVMNGGCISWGVKCWVLVLSEVAKEAIYYNTDTDVTRFSKDNFDSKKFEPNPIFH